MCGAFPGTGLVLRLADTRQKPHNRLDAAMEVCQMEFLVGRVQVSSGSPNPIRMLGMPSSRMKSPMIGIDPPLRMKTVSLRRPRASPRSRAHVRVLRRNHHRVAGVDQPHLHRDSLRTDRLHVCLEERKALRRRHLGTSRIDTFATARARNHSLRPAPVNPPAMPCTSSVGRARCVPGPRIQPRRSAPSIPPPYRGRPLHRRAAPSTLSVRRRMAPPRDRKSEESKSVPIRPLISQ